MRNFPWSHKLTNGMKMWKGNGNITTLLFSLKGVEILLTAFFFTSSDLLSSKQTCQSINQLIRLKGIFELNLCKDFRPHADNHSLKVDISTKYLITFLWNICQIAQGIHISSLNSHIQIKHEPVIGNKIKSEKQNFLTLC